MTDPIADMLTRIRNASLVKKKQVYIPFSKIKLEILRLLKAEGFIKGFEEIKPGSTGQKFGGLEVELKYNGANSAITSLKKISKPGRRIYAASDELPRVLNDLGIAIISTSSGVMTNKKARKMGLGGEIICEVY
ncbi:MAG: 30S ribosomal protein S8 [Candidatus Buchananbacteria bacterium RIFCSPHIGHO2_02_FULL_40_13]|uniref:Small ribosomal subunit protein uS8 n=1 Tax=Candidatus Buchananbacteria bacterium RIFCSPLOWO2_01_FULL_39_33 TaxID=1797543 RepID=A0A1G1YL41_9BACT|nr:MAG: 30S ribosomal protein S8 [Candidatus Buchananbacteria bacterium RIFCSPHIGHO2_01_FULL_40_35]OGY50581.1 MAG: 30S ribosomal protein S8 [Candidatus Buchananbacteria bacterium RIFCSPHIGHO2_02_FULL_40_13]OGY53052.1 MAG: 30S ribosomal protein S8 [Candidatus Buchananbacteria bacterium RIFCSPLOWO2_01_FULL_39_33]